MHLATYRSLCDVCLVCTRCRQTKYARQHYTNTNHFSTVHLLPKGLGKLVSSDGSEETVTARLMLSWDNERLASSNFTLRQRKKVRRGDILRIGRVANPLAVFSAIWTPRIRWQCGLVLCLCMETSPWTTIWDLSA